LAAAAARDDEIDQIVIAHEAIVAAARKSDLPTAWMRIADAVPQPTLSPSLMVRLGCQTFSRLTLV
jgi:hypothetical protein